MKMKRGKIILGLLFAIVILTACSSNHKSDAYGNFEATDILLSAESAGKIIDFTLDEGDIVEKNQIIAVIDTTQLALTKKELIVQKNIVENKIKAMDKEISALKINIETLKKNQERIHNLVLDNAATLKEKDEIDGQVKATNEKLNALLENRNAVINEKELLSIKNEKIIDQINKCKIRATMKATVLEKYKSLGELAAPGQPVCKLADLENITLRAYVSGNDLSRIKLGQTVKVMIDNGANSMRSYDGTITYIADKAEFTPKVVQTREERTKLVYAMKINVKNDGAIKIAMPGEVLFK